MEKKYNKTKTKNFNSRNKPKGYKRLKIPNTFTGNSSNNNMLNLKDDSLFYGIIHITLTSLTPVAVGSGMEEISDYYSNSKINDKIIELQYKLGNTPTIPGSSLKGVVRTYCEILSSKELGNNIFGSIKTSHEHIGRVLFEDLKAKKSSSVLFEIPKQFSGRSKTDNYKIYSHTIHEDLISDVKKNNNNLAYNDKRIIEACDKDTIFEGNIVINGLSKEELGLLLLSMGLSKSNRFAIKIGRGKNFDMGSVLITINNFEIATAKEYFFGNFPDADKEERVNYFINSYFNKMNEDARNNLRTLVEDSKTILRG